MTDRYYAFLIHRHARGGYTIGDVTMAKLSEDDASRIFFDHAEDTQAVSTLVEARQSLADRLTEIERQISLIEERMREDDPDEPMIMPRVLAPADEKPGRGWLRVIGGRG